MKINKQGGHNKVCVCVCGGGGGSEKIKRPSIKDLRVVYFLTVSLLHLMFINLNVYDHYIYIFIFYNYTSICMFPVTAFLSNMQTPVFF